MKDDTKPTGTLHALPGAQIAGAMLALFKRAAPDIIATQPVIAEMRRASYQAHIAAGFTETQALELCTKLELRG